MTKSLMIPIRPEHAVNILNGDKDRELRKWIPKDYVGWVYVYVTKGVKDVLHKYKDKYYTHHYLTFIYPVEALNSKVAFRFWFDEYDKYVDVSNCGMTSCGFECDYDFIYGLYNLDDELKKLCLTYDEVENYGKGKDLYAWHIKKLEIFDEPKSLSDFYKGNRYPNGEIITPNICEFSPFDYDNDLETCLDSFRLKKAPQKMVWVYTND